MKLLKWFHRKKNPLLEDYKNNEATIYKDLSPEVKTAMAEGAMREACKLLMFTFMSCDLKTHMVCNVINKATGDIYLLSFTKTDVPMDKKQ